MNKSDTIFAIFMRDILSIPVNDLAVIFEA